MYFICNLNIYLNYKFVIRALIEITNLIKTRAGMLFLLRFKILNKICIIIKIIKSIGRGML